ncbi:hypothetical protein LAZ67_3001410 [Cordylochernes scorpioides]|uniref:Reverse transcriptase domain-containing protein n=1 Tax=Cordylochernes scorpioides TaxID=51811 RepID=A0ABY6K8P0_9ARAC|nr:hypothetical protein LAZ67_3001410 [Cordylochernes scorpioides]
MYNNINYHIPRIIAGVEPALRGLNHQDTHRIRHFVTSTLQRPYNIPKPSLAMNRVISRLKRNRDIVITKSDKGSQTVILNTTVYKQKMQNVLDQHSIFSAITEQEHKTSVKNFRLLLLRLKRSQQITKEQYNDFTANLAQIAYIYGLPKIHKPDVPLRPIISYHLSPAYTLSKFLSNFLTPLLQSPPWEYTIANSPSFVSYITSLTPPPRSIMVSFDVTSLYLSLAHPLIINSLRTFLENASLLDTLTAETVVELTSICLGMSTFTFDTQFFKQTKGSPMGSPLSTVVAEVVMRSLDQWITSRHSSDIFLWRRYIDDTFCLVSEVSASHILSDLNSFHPDIAFTHETENHSVLPFLDTLVIRTPSSFHTTVYYKNNTPPHHTNFRSHCPTPHKINTVRALTKRIFTHCSLPLFQTIEKAKIFSYLSKSGYPTPFILKHMHDPHHNSAPAIHRNICSLPFCPQSITIARFLRQHGITTYFQNPPNIATLIRHPITRSSLHASSLRSGGAVYSVSCDQCNATYVGETALSSVDIFPHSLLRIYPGVKFSKSERRRRNASWVLLTVFSWLIAHIGAAYSKVGRTIVSRSFITEVKKLMAEDMQITDDVVIAECHRLDRGPKAPILIEVPDHESRIGNKIHKNEDVQSRNKTQLTGTPHISHSKTHVIKESQLKDTNLKHNKIKIEKIKPMVDIAKNERFMYWNINGFFRINSLFALFEYLKQFEMFALTETWCHFNIDLNLANFGVYQSPAVKSTDKGRSSGGQRRLHACDTLHLKACLRQNSHFHHTSNLKSLNNIFTKSATTSKHNTYEHRENCIFQIDHKTANKLSPLSKGVEPVNQFSNVHLNPQNCNKTRISKTSDRAPTFTSEKFRKFLLTHSIQPLLTTSNNPQASVLIERLNATITGKLRLAYLENTKASWTQLVKRITQTYNNTPHSVTSFPPTYLMFNVVPPDLRTHLNIYPEITRTREIARSRTQNKHEKKIKKHLIRSTEHHISKHPDTGKLAPYSTEPYTIIEIISPNVVRIDRPNQPLNRDSDTIHVNKLKYYTENVLYITPPQPRFVQNPQRLSQDLYLSEFNHLTTDIFGTQQFRVIPPTTSQPFLHL